MKGTEFQKAHPVGVATYATHTPVQTPTPGGYPYGSVPKTAGPESNLVPIIGLTVLVVLLIAMSVIAVLRANEASAPVATTGIAQGSAVGALAVPHGALPAVDTLVVAPTAAGPVAVAVPHGALAAVDTTPVAPTVVLVPHGAAPVE